MRRTPPTWANWPTLLTWDPRGPWALSNVGFTRFLLLESVRAEPTPLPPRISRPNFEGSSNPPLHLDEMEPG